MLELKPKPPEVKVLSRVVLSEEALVAPQMTAASSTCGLRKSLTLLGCRFGMDIQLQSFMYLGRA